MEKDELKEKIFQSDDEELVQFARDMPKHLTGLEIMARFNKTVSVLTWLSNTGPITRHKERW